MRVSVLRSFLAVLTAGVFLGALVMPASADFLSDLDTSAGLTVLGTADTASTFGYDYSADGIPSAPNGSGTTGLKLEANITSGAVHEIAVVTNDSFSGLYRVQVDMWVNANGPFPAGGTGSTEFGGLGVGHDGSTVGRDGGTLLIDGEGGSGLADYRFYKDTSFVSFNTDAQYSIDNLNVDGTADSVVEIAFPGVAPPGSQSQTGTPLDGSGGFQWMTLDALVNSVAGTATYTVTSNASGNTVVIGTLNNVTTAFDTSGRVSLNYVDIFTSVSDNAALSFGVFDNLKVTVIPEPASIALLGMALIGLIGVGRRPRR